MVRSVAIFASGLLSESREDLRALFAGAEDCFSEDQQARNFEDSSHTRGLSNVRYYVPTSGRPNNELVE